MTVGFDVTWMEADNKSGGVFQYAFRLISALVEYTNISVVAIVSNSGKGIFEHLKPHQNFREVLLEPSLSLKDIVESEKLDVIHSPVQTFPNLTFTVPMISTLHDLQHFYYPEFFTQHAIESRDTSYRHAAEFSERVIVSFQHVKEDIVKFYGIPAEKIDVCPLGTIQPEFSENRIFSGKMKKYHIPDKYIFYPANTWRHKNHISLIRALKTVREKNDISIALVCTGQKCADHYPDLKSEVKKLGLEKHVFFTGYIPEEDVRVLLKKASLVVIPTLYEAGSFPLMEAMAYEVPVICSDVTSLPDTIGDRRFVFDPKDIDQIAERISMMLKDERLLEDNRTNSRKRVSEGGWDNVVDNFLKTYAKAITSSKENKDMGTIKNKIRIYELLMNDSMEQMRMHIDAFQSSLSWKITAPLRWLHHKLITKQNMR